MRKKIIEALKTRYKNLGFSEKAFDGVAAYLEPSIKDESEIETAIGGVESLLKVFQGEADTIRTSKSASDKKLAELEAKIKELSGGPEPTPAPTPGGEDTPAWAQALIEQNKALTERLNRLDVDRTTNSRKQQLSEVIATLPEMLRKPYERMSVESLKEEEFTNLLSEVKTEVAGIVSETKAKGAVFGRPVNSGKASQGSNKEATNEEAQAVVDRLGI